MSLDSVKGAGQRLFLRGIMNMSDETGYIKGAIPMGIFHVWFQT